MVLRTSITKLTPSSDCLLHPLSALFLDMGMFRILCVIYLVIILAHIQDWKEKSKAHLFLPLDERSSATCCFVSVSRKEK